MDRTKETRKLVAKKTRRVIEPGDPVLTFRGEEGVFQYISPNRRNHIVISLGGRDREYYPSVIEAEIVEGE